MNHTMSSSSWFIVWFTHMNHTMINHLGRLMTVLCFNFSRTIRQPEHSFSCLLEFISRKQQGGLINSSYGPNLVHPELVSVQPRLDRSGSSDSKAKSVARRRCCKNMCMCVERQKCLLLKALFRAGMMDCQGGSTQNWGP